MELTISKDKYIQLRNSGMSQDEIVKRYSKKSTYENFSNVANKVVDFIPGLRTATENFASGLAQLPEGTATRALGIPGTRNTMEESLIQKNSPTVKQSLGSALQLGANFIPVGRLASSLGSAAGGVVGTQFAKGLGQIGAGALTGYAFDVGHNLETNAPNASKAGIGTAIGTAIPIAALGINKFLQSLAKNTPETQLFNMTKDFKTVANAYKKGVKYQIIDGKKVVSSDPIETLIREKAIPGVTNYKVDPTIARETLGKKIEGFANLNKSSVAEASKRGVSVPLSSISDDIERAIRSSDDLKAAGAVGKTLTKAQAILDDFKMSYGDELPIAAVDEIRVAMNRVYDPEVRDAARTIGDAMRKAQYELVPTSRAVLRKEGELISAMRFLDALDGRVVNRGRLGKYFGELIGAIAGSTIDIPVVGPVAGALGARSIASRIARSHFNPIGSQPARRALQGIENSTIRSPGDLFLDSQTGQKVSEYVQTAQPGLSTKVVRLHPEDSKALTDFIDAARLKKDVPESVLTGAEKIFERMDISLDQPMTVLANKAEDILTGKIDASILYKTGREFSTAIPKELEGLAAEARKYKTAEEFVKAQGADTYFHTTTQSAAQKINIEGFSTKLGDRTQAIGSNISKNNAEGVFLYKNDRDAAEYFAKNFKDGAEIIETKVFGKILRTEKSPNELTKDYIESVRQRGYVGIQGKELGTDYTFVFSPDAIKTKSQLIDFYNKVMGIDK